MMNVEQLMTTDFVACTPNHGLDCAARIMWERDCGVVPILDNTKRVVGMITDRDIAMAAYIKNGPLTTIPIASIALKPVVAVRRTDSVETAETLMQKHQIRRLAVIDDNGRLVGMLSLNDLVRNVGRHPRELSTDGVVQTLAAISQPRAMPTSTARA